MVQATGRFSFRQCVDRSCFEFSHVKRFADYAIIALPVVGGRSLQFYV